MRWRGHVTKWIRGWVRVWVGWVRIRKELHTMLMKNVINLLRLSVKRLKSAFTMRLNGFSTIIISHSSQEKRTSWTPMVISQTRIRTVKSQTHNTNWLTCSIKQTITTSRQSSESCSKDSPISSLDKTWSKKRRACALSAAINSCKKWSTFSKCKLNRSPPRLPLWRPN